MKKIDDLSPKEVAKAGGNIGDIMYAMEIDYLETNPTAAREWAEDLFVEYSLGQRRFDQRTKEFEEFLQEERKIK